MADRTKTLASFTALLADGWPPCSQRGPILTTKDGTRIHALVEDDQGVTFAIGNGPRMSQRHCEYLSDVDGLLAEFGGRS